MSKKKVVVDPAEEVRKKLRAGDVGFYGVSVYRGRASINLCSAYLDFALLEKVSKALGTTDINVEGSVEHGYYAETNANLTLDVGLGENI